MREKLRDEENLITRKAMFITRNAEARSHDDCLRGQEKSIKYYECMFVYVALFIVHAKCVRRVILSHVSYWLHHIFSHYLIKRKYPEKSY
jgi:hypothetical protein